MSSSPEGGASAGRRALGRGLAALMPSSPQQAPANAQSEGLRYVPIEKIRPNPRQPRKHFDADLLDELAASIREQGVLQPIVVRRASGTAGASGTGGHDEGYEIIAGERRWRASGRAGLQQIPAVIKDASDSDALQVALVENLQRADLDPLEEAEAYARLIREHGMTQEEVGQAVGKSRTAITNSLRLLKLPPPILELLAEGKLTAGHARALMMLKNEHDVPKLAADIVKRGASVREAESTARMLNRSSTDEAPPARSAADVAFEERLQRGLQTKVRVQHVNGKGKLEIYFHSYAHLDELVEKLGL